MTRLAVRDVQLCVGCDLCMFACARRQNDVGNQSSCIGIKSAGGMEYGFTVVVCRACTDPPCMHVCPVGALTLRKGGGVILNKTKCIGCKNCVNGCILGAAFWDSQNNKPLICIHCGICVKYCPHNVLELENRETIAEAKGGEAIATE